MQCCRSVVMDQIEFVITTSCPLHTHSHRHTHTHAQQGYCTDLFLFDFWRRSFNIMRRWASPSLKGRTRAPHWDLEMILIRNQIVSCRLLSLGAPLSVQFFKKNCIFTPIGTGKAHFKDDRKAEGTAAFASLPKKTITKTLLVCNV